MRLLEPVLKLLASLTALLVVLRLNGALDWPWWLVTMPLVAALAVICGLWAFETYVQVATALSERRDGRNFDEK